MASITSWTRLEPRTERLDLADGLAARLHDPLWQLARQWQIGEFTAEDTGSPVQARVRVQRGRVTRFRAGPAPAAGTVDRGVPFDARVVPLETLVEAEPFVPTARFAAAAGLRFVELLAARDLPGQGWIDAFPLAVRDDDRRLDAAGRRFLAVVGGRAPDGVALRAACGAAPGSLPSRPAVAVADADRETATAVVRQFVAWYDAETAVPVGATSWQRDRMEYEFAVGAPLGTGEVVLDAPEYRGGLLDWSAFDVRATGSLGARDDEGASTVTRTVIPSRVSYRGMPAARWWQFEDGRVDFGAVEAGPTDLLRLLFVAFAVDYGNDWFVVPVELEVGSVYQVESLVVTDSFGQRTLVRHASDVDGAFGSWRMFHPTAIGGSPLITIAAMGDPGQGLLVLAPTLAGTLEGEPVEEVALLRDEMANLAWAVERVVEGAAGGRVDRVAEVAAARATPPPPGDGVGLRYRLATTVPENWLPLVPVRPDPAEPDIRLRRGRVLLDREGEPVEPVALGRLLEPGTPLELREEEVPRGGVRVTRAAQLTRWLGGSTHRWTGRRTSQGRGEAWSRLRFDITEPDT